jgi:hypothetical protein
MSLFACTVYSFRLFVKRRLKIIISRLDCRSAAFKAQEPDLLYLSELALK